MIGGIGAYDRRQSGPKRAGRGGQARAPPATHGGGDLTRDQCPRALRNFPNEHHDDIEQARWFVSVVGTCFQGPAMPHSLRFTPREP